MTTIFSQIIEGKIPAEKVFENERIVAIHDIHPVAPVHLLILPKKQIQDLQSVTKEDYPLIIEIIQVAQQLALQFKIETGYRLLTNNGQEAGQTIFHLHFHLMGGKPLTHLAE
ncbi:MAG: histidine triad nucleotide-binding protein [Candidatus Rhabdochlamydia sp.]